MIGVKAGTAVAAAVAVVESLNGVAQQLAILAGIVVSVGILIAAAKRSGAVLARWIAKTPIAKKIDAIFDSTHDLREWREHVDLRLEDGSRQFDDLRQALQVLSEGERAAVRGALEAVATPIPPRPARRTDEIAERDGWRE